MRSRPSTGAARLHPRQTSRRLHRGDCRVSLDIDHGEVATGHADLGMAGQRAYEPRTTERANGWNYANIGDPNVPFVGSRSNPKMTSRTHEAGQHSEMGGQPRGGEQRDSTGAGDRNGQRARARSRQRMKSNSARAFRMLRLEAHA